MRERRLHPCVLRDLAIDAQGRPIVVMDANHWLAAPRAWALGGRVLTIEDATGRRYDLGVVAHLQLPALLAARTLTVMARTPDGAIRCIDLDRVD